MYRIEVLFSGYLRDLTQDKSIQLNYVELDIVCDGLFILSCLGELDIHRKVRREMFSVEIKIRLFLGNLWFGRN